jgi:alpha-galactosidase
MDFASTLGTGGVPGTKFVWPDPGPKYKPVALTTQKEEHWKKWIALYNQKMLSKGEFRNLYVYGYDTPEAYAIEKDEKMYYAFFADPGKPFSGEIELRGLKPGRYEVVDYTDGKNMGTVQAENGTVAHLKTDFKEHLLLEVSAKQ